MAYITACTTVQAVMSIYASFEAASLATSQAASGFQTDYIVLKALHGTAPPYLAEVCRSETLEQSASTSATAGSKCWAISTGTKDASVCGCMTATPSDYCFPPPDINILTYLLIKIILTYTGSQNA